MLYILLVILYVYMHVHLSLVYVFNELLFIIIIVEAGC